MLREIFWVWLCGRLCGYIGNLPCRRST